MQADMVTLALASSKGGVGKTTLSVTLATLFAAQGVRTLVVDMDSQGHVASYLGAPRGDAAYRLLAGVDAGGMMIPARDTLLRGVRPHLDVVVGSPRTAFAEHLLRERMGAERALSRRLAEVQHEYDVCLIDVPPGFSLVSSVALYAAQVVLIPVAPGSGPESGVVDLSARLLQMRAEVDRAPTLLGLVPNMLDRRERESRALLSFAAGYPCAPGIRRSVRLPESVRAGQTISEFEPGGAAAQDYAALADWTALRLGEFT